MAHTASTTRSFAPQASTFRSFLAFPQVSANPSNLLIRVMTHMMGDQLVETASTFKITGRPFRRTTSQCLSGQSFRSSFAPMLSPLRLAQRCFFLNSNYFHLGCGPNIGVGSGSLIVIFERMAEYIIQVRWLFSPFGSVLTFICFFFLRRLFRRCSERTSRLWLPSKKLSMATWITSQRTSKRRSTRRSVQPGTRTTSTTGKFLFREVPERRADKCSPLRSPVLALWPGSGLHAVKTLEHPRWEDFDYVRTTKERFSWLGAGYTVAETDPDADKAWYLNELDYPPVPK